MLGLEPVQPRQLPGTLQLGWSRLGERPEVGRVTVVRLPPVSAVAQAFQRVLPDGSVQQYNDFTFFPDLGNWGEVYNDIGVTPEAFLTTPFGDIDFPTSVR